jgi:WD40 repeat protein
MNHSTVLFQTRDPKGTVTLHDLCSQKIVQTYETFSNTFCASVPCHHHSKLLAIPTPQHETVMIKDLRAKEAVAVVSTNPKHDHASSSNGHGMVTSMAMMQLHNEIVLSCGMEDGTVLLHNVTNGGRNRTTDDSCSGKFSLGKEPVLALDVTGSGGVCKSPDSQQHHASLLLAAGLAGDASEMTAMDPLHQGRAVLFKATQTKRQDWKFQLRARLSTCQVHALSAGKPGVAVCRFREGDGRLLAIGGWDHRIRLFERSSAKPLAILKPDYGSGSVNALDWSPDASTSGLLASAAGGTTKMVSIWQCYPRPERNVDNKSLHRSCDATVVSIESQQQDEPTERKRPLATSIDTVDNAGSDDIITITQVTPSLSCKQLRPCHVCQTPCHTRCKQCQSVYYCSAKCQGQDWKNGHRQECANTKVRQGPLPAKIRSTDEALMYLEELGRLTTMNDDTGEAKEASLATKQCVNSSPPCGASSVVRDSFDEKEEKEEDNPTKTNGTKNSNDVSTSQAFALTGNVDGIHPSVVSMLVEEMPQISCFQVTLKLSVGFDNIQSHELDITAEPASKPDKTLVVISNRSSDSKATLFAGEFIYPIRADDVSLQQEKEKDDKQSLNVITVRLPHEPNLASSGLLLDSQSEQTTASLTDINNAACGSCHMPLFLKDAVATYGTRPRSTIEKTLPLPQGHWDDIADYLICYSGQPIVDFTSGGVITQAHVALQDANLLCLHPSDVPKSVCVLAVSNYGETTNSSIGTDSDGTEINKDITGGAAEQKATAVAATSAAIRGDRSWQGDSTGGDSVTLCCTQCCAPLGFCSLTNPDSWRLWKHRLAIIESTEARSFPTTAAIPNNAVPLAKTRPMASCMSFLAREMVRYAESKAIFTFVVGLDQEVFADAKGKNNNRYLLLRLLSWETAAAWSDKTTRGLAISPRLKFYRVAKIIFEEVVDPTVNGLTKHQIGNEFALGQQWIWGGVDLCCPPGTAGQHGALEMNGRIAPVALLQPTQSRIRASSVRINLPADDYRQVQKELANGQHLFSKSQAEATILIKMGETRESLGMTMVAL